MSNWLYVLYAVILGIVSWFTGEIVTFVMLGVILIALNNINSTLKKIYLQNNERSNNEDKQ
ncbi:hypothetical protein QUF81_07565 [Peribacillus simplex]|jgi:hypothetical protein|uniref:Uncharacterized protein n=1 Tax=Peribacillus simplex TaxID=1478 RepID=A0AAW7IEK4_9BACI|nr:hypothetical protein [Peribacillus simplex]AMM94647.1 hypothetical protein UP17_21015 [Peribacillus simplex]MDM5293051.1 hypothetical protein [Peribacillus simplex]MDM5451959.1 hypothetical protein [Peribacillus simplex]